MKPQHILLIALLTLGPWAQTRAQTRTSKDFLPPAAAGKAWKLIWQDEFDGTQLDETKWNRHGDSKRRDGFWIKDDAYLSGNGTLLLRTRKDGDCYICGAEEIGDWAGDIRKARLPDYFEVEYMRVYELSP